MTPSIDGSGLGLEDTIASRLIGYAQRCLDCLDRDTFDVSLQALVRGVHQALFTATPELGARSLERAFGLAAGQPRIKRLLELALAPLYDKPELPTVASGGAGQLQCGREFLWIFTIPVTVTFTPEQAQEPFALDAQLFDGSAVIDALRTFGYFDKDALLRVFGALWQREDLHVHGPRFWSQAFVTCELFEADAPQALAVAVTEELPLYRSVQFNIMGCLRVPVGTAHLVNACADTRGFTQRVGQIIGEALVCAEVGVERVQAFEPTPLAASYLLSLEPSQSAVQASLRAAAACGARAALLRYPSPDYVELAVSDAQGDVTLVLPATLAVEPKAALVGAFAESARAAGLEWAGVQISRHMSTATRALH